jgi:hypothetical protein
MLALRGRNGLTGSHQEFERTARKQWWLQSPRLLIARLTIESQPQEAFICGNEETRCLAYAGFCYAKGGFFLEQTYHWHNCNWDFHAKRTYPTISPENKIEIIRLTFAGLETGRIRSKMDESMPPKRLYDAHCPISVKLKQRRAEKIRNSFQRWRYWDIEVTTVADWWRGGWTHFLDRTAAQRRSSEGPANLNGPLADQVAGIWHGISLEDALAPSPAHTSWCWFGMIFWFEMWPSRIDFSSLSLERVIRCQLSVSAGSNFEFLFSIVFVGRSKFGLIS